MTQNYLYTTPMSELSKEFSYRGLALLSPDQLGIDTTVHQEVYNREKALHDAGEAITPQNVPAILKVLSAPGLDEAVKTLIGEDWAVVPFAHNAPFCSGGRDQQWHKDDNGPYNMRKMRHHHSVQLEMLYYPQAVTDLMGPTATIPYSHYWTFDHETNQDNFAGADHLDFDYLMSGMEHIQVSGPDSPYDEEDIIQRRTKHDKRMRDKVAETGWPLVFPLEAAPIPAGSVLLYSHNTFHRGNHRRDDWRTWQDNPRFMWRFYLFRTTDPKPMHIVPDVDWNNLGADPLTKVPLTADKDLLSLWRHQHNWQTYGAASSDQQALNKDELEALSTQLFIKHESGEAKRIGAAYQLAEAGSDALPYLKQGIHAERESVRRAATYGLSAMGTTATPILIETLQSADKWVRKAGLFALGEVAALNQQNLDLLIKHLQQEESVYLRSVAAGSIGCMARRGIAHEERLALIPQCVAVLIEQFGKEENRLSMDRVQGRGIKMVRPTDECDVCEGNGVNFGIERFDPVRSAVNENIMWSLVMLSTHKVHLGNQLDALVHLLNNIIENEKNVLVWGYALDALQRLAKGDAEAEEKLLHVLQGQPLHCCESLVRAGMDLTTIKQISQSLSTRSEGAYV